jgi:DMSO/TMAO reductase YedYZ molybdopterin-dependent catalytic subunit
VSEVRQKTRLLTVASVLIIIVVVSASAIQWVNTPSSTSQPNATPSAVPSSSTSTSPTATPSVNPSTPAPSGSASPTPSSTPIPTPIPLYPGEVREYQGQNLSSITYVYDNAIAGTQRINNATYSLEIFGLVNRTRFLSYTDVIENHQLYQKVVTIYCVEGWDATILWEGVLVKDLIAEASPNPNATTVIFYAADGYTTALPREYLVDNNIILAWKMNGVVLPPEKGFPFQLVAESKYGYKWIKWVTGIELSNNTDYLGYWESRGYSNDATVP